MDIEELIDYFVKGNEKGIKDRVIGLSGILGSGKTHFVKKLLEKILPELSDQVTSPTYNLCNVYKNQNIEIHHYDLYRIESEDELYDTGIMESIENGKVTVFIEWIDLFPDLERFCDKTINIEIISNDQRNYQIVTDS